MHRNNCWIIHAFVNLIRESVKIPANHFRLLHERKFQYEFLITFVKALISSLLNSSCTKASKTEFCYRSRSCSCELINSHQTHAYQQRSRVPINRERWETIFHPPTQLYAWTTTSVKLLEFIVREFNWNFLQFPTNTLLNVKKLLPFFRFSYFIVVVATTPAIAASSLSSIF